VLHYRPMSRRLRLTRQATGAGRLDPRLLVVLAATLWGTTGTARALGPDDASPSAVGAARLVVGGACLIAAARWGGLGASRPADATRSAIRSRPTEASRSVAAAGHARVPLAVAAVAMAAYQPLFFGGVARTGVAVGTVVGIGSSPVFAGILGAVVRGERPGGRWLAATGLALAGTALLVGTGGSDDVDPAGIALALGAGLAYAIYVLASKLVLDQGWAPDTLTVRVFAWAGLLLVPVALAAGVGPLLTPGGLLMVAHLGIITVAVAYVLFSRGLHGVGVGAAGTLTLAEPATAAVLGVVVVGERFGSATAAGIALIAAGLVVLVARRR
jgi:DME family drug/metabolite transporter